FTDKVIPISFSYLHPPAPSPFFLQYSLPLRYLLSFPTRRSSDLLYEELPGTRRSRNHSRSWANEQGNTQTPAALPVGGVITAVSDRKSTRLNSSHGSISYAVFCLKKKTRRTEDSSDRNNNLEFGR